MNQPVAIADEDVHATIQALSAEVQAALALTRAAVTAITTASPLVGAAAEQALDEELERARRLVASQRTTDILEQIQRRLQAIPAELARADMLERALIAAAEALPDIPEPQGLGRRAAG